MLRGKETIPVDRALAGRHRRRGKVDEIVYDAVLHDSHDEDQFHLSPSSSPAPIYGLAIEPAKRGDEQRLWEIMQKLAAEDPCLKIEHVASTNETIVQGFGELHLRVLLEKLTKQYKLEVKTHPPRIAYRETITPKRRDISRHKKQTGGAGQFGEVFLRVEPLPRGEGFEFVDEVRGGAIPGQFIPAVEKGVRQVIEQGAISGYPMQDVRVIVYDGKSHPVDSKEIAFVSAGRKAFLDAVAKARPIVLEPIVNIQVNVPEGNIGDVTGDLSVQARPRERHLLDGRRPHLGEWSGASLGAEWLRLAPQVVDRRTRLVQRGVQPLRASAPQRATATGHATQGAGAGRLTGRRSLKLLLNGGQSSRTSARTAPARSCRAMSFTTAPLLRTHHPFDLDAVIRDVSAPPRPAAGNDRLVGTALELAHLLTKSAGFQSRAVR